MKVRKSNFELMRIISMFMIIIWHIFLYGVDMDMASPKMKIYFDIFRSIFVVHVNSFVLLSGFFQCQSNFKLSKVLQLNNAVIFYKIVIFLIFCGRRVRGCRRRGRRVPQPPGEPGRRPAQIGRAHV